MAIKLVIDNKVTFTVKGTYKDAKGITKPFDFDLTCNRLDDDAFAEKVSAATPDTSITDFMADVTEGWGRVTDDNGAPVEFTEAGFRTLCKIPGVGRLCFDTFRQEVGVKAKN